MQGRTPDPDREPRGFAGLSSLVSEVDEAIGESERYTSRPRSGSSEAGAAATPGERAQASARSNADEPSTGWQPSDGPSPWKVFFGGLAVVLVLVMMAEGNSYDSPATSSPSSSTRATSQPPNADGPDPFDSLWEQVTAPVKEDPLAGYTSDWRRNNSSRPSEERPPVGRGRTLNVEQIRYCLAESIRIDAADPLLHNYSQLEVNTFNQLVDDYNSRCSDYRYYEGTLSRARREVESQRSTLLADGRRRFLEQVGRLPSRADVETYLSQYDERVQTVQSLLNQRGYNAGPADGLMGPTTREAIRQFQRDRGMTPDGQASAAVLYVLKYR